jgi:small subunit ribosomal protein S6
MNDKRTYEAMFLLDSGTDFETASRPVQAVLERNQAEIAAIKPWEDRPLAYPISGRRRGLYVLSYFSVDPSKMPEIEHDCQLDERVLRALFVAKDKLTEEEIDAETPAGLAAQRAAERAAAESDSASEAEPSDEKAPERETKSAEAKSEAPAEKKPEEGEPEQKDEGQQKDEGEKPESEKTPAEGGEGENQ